MVLCMEVSWAFAGYVGGDEGMSSSARPSTSMQFPNTKT